MSDPHTMERVVECAMALGMFIGAAHRALGTDGESWVEQVKMKFDESGLDIATKDGTIHALKLTCEHVLDEINKYNATKNN